MLQVDIEVPVMGRTYEFLIDENLTVETVTVRVASAICIKEQCMSSGNEKNFMLWDKERRIRLLPEKTVSEMGVAAGSRLLLI
ncbi:MAG TPA: hypothetical protein H9732_04720 [Candidatus Mediterraneibacter avicola]|nr:hypothetical protein [Candidatus Mediterraneibacter avicola]